MEGGEPRRQGLWTQHGDGVGALKWDEGYEEGLRAKESDEWGQRGHRSQEGEGQRDRDTDKCYPRKWQKRCS